MKTIPIVILALASAFASAGTFEFGDCRIYRSDRSSEGIESVNSIDAVWGVFRSFSTAAWGSYGTAEWANPVFEWDVIWTRSGSEPVPGQTQVNFWVRGKASLSILMTGNPSMSGFIDLSLDNWYANYDLSRVFSGFMTTGTAGHSSILNYPDYVSFTGSFEPYSPGKWKATVQMSVQASLLTQRTLQGPLAAYSGDTRFTATPRPIP